MGLENYYLKLPDFIKFNPRILKLSFDMTDRINNSTGVSTEDFLSNLTGEDGKLTFTHTTGEIPAPRKRTSMGTATPPRDRSISAPSSGQGGNLLSSED